MTISQIEQDRDKELKEIHDKNEENKGQVHDMALQSKAELQLIKNKMNDIKADMEGLQRNIKDQNNAVKKQENALKGFNDDMKTLKK